jgi:hypothetical protein
MDTSRLVRPMKGDRRRGTLSRCFRHTRQARITPSRAFLVVKEIARAVLGGSASLPPEQLEGVAKWLVRHEVARRAEVL